MKIVLGALCAWALAAGAQAAVILSPAAVTIDSGGPGTGSAENVINRTGLLTPFVSGVDDFDAYMASNPRHGRTAFGQEWFSQDGSETASLTFDLGQTYFVEGLAWWNDETAGSGRVDVVIFGMTVASFDPANHVQLALSYVADVAKFAPVATRYVTIVMKDCPQPALDNPPPQRCAVGEAAFAVTAVPEPATWAAMIGGFALIGGALRRRARTVRA